MKQSNGNESQENEMLPITNDELLALAGDPQNQPPKSWWDDPINPFEPGGLNDEQT